MKAIGITGGIGSGKSIIGKILEVMGYPVFYSDAEAKLLMTRDPELKKGLIHLLGEAAYSGDELNRSYISGRLFSDPAVKKSIDELVHPATYRAFDKWKAKQTSALVFLESALMFETGSYKRFDYTILIIADHSTKIERIIQRDNIKHKQVIERMNNQLPDEKKVVLADFIIDNSSHKMIIPQLLNILNKITNR